MFEAVMFYVFAAVVLGSAVGCVVSTNIVRTAVWLLGALGGVAGLYFLLFGVMLTSKSPWMKFNPSRAEVALAAGVGLAMFGGLTAAMLSVDWSASAAGLSANALVSDIGKNLLTAYLVPFEAASVLLLAVMIGAAYLARAERRQP
jgi:NAD(P)H-quinone oxidoreductase subunit 6